MLQSLASTQDILKLLAILINLAHYLYRLLVTITWINYINSLDRYSCRSYYQMLTTVSWGKSS